MQNNVLIIAEAGVNHNGSIQIAKDLIDAATNAGADIVKFQTFKAEKLVTPYAVKANYQFDNQNELDNTQKSMLEKLELTDDMHRELIQYSELKGIKFCSTAFDIESLDFLVKLGVEIIKIPSGEITNFPFLKHVSKLNRPVVMSTGMSTLGEIESALNILEVNGLDKSKISLLHCNSDYPTPMIDVNLNAIKSMNIAFGLPVGYSDHTLGIEVPIAAVALGATIIEKHLTLDKSFEGPDHKVSLDPFEFKNMVNSIRNIEIALGDGIKRNTASESKNKSNVRKSIVALCNIKKGEMFSEKNLTTKRPGTGITPMQWDNIIGTISKRDFIKNELIEI